MADSKISALTAATTVNAADQFAIVQSGASKMATGSMARGYLTSPTAVITVSAAYAVDTYLAGSAITIPTAGGWKARTLYMCNFDMVKTAAGSAAFTIQVRMGTLGTTGDASIGSLVFGAGTAVADTGYFQFAADFRAVGSGTSAFLQMFCQCPHALAATGLHSTGVSGWGAVLGTSAGFNSTTQTVIGLSINGGASFSGTSTMVQSYLFGF